VARNASRSRQVVVVVDMAVQADSGRIRVRVGQKESDRGMVKAGGLPGDCGVALLAGLRESARHVVGALCALVIREMACHAGRRAEGVVIVDMAVQADSRRIRVRVSKWESHARVVEFRIDPGACAVTQFATR